jgi:hypothetical protein
MWPHWMCSIATHQENPKTIKILHLNGGLGTKRQSRLKRVGDELMYLHYLEQNNSSLCSILEVRISITCIWMFSIIGAGVHFIYLLHKKSQISQCLFLQPSSSPTQTMSTQSFQILVAVFLAAKYSVVIPWICHPMHSVSWHKKDYPAVSMVSIKRGEFFHSTLPDM